MSDAAVAQFTEIAGASARVAAQYLQVTDNDLESAMQLYFENGGSELQLPESETPSAPRPSAGRQRSSNYEDEEGIVHLDSDDNNDGTGIVPVPSRGYRPPATNDHDMEVARRLQEELYSEGGGGGIGGGGGGSGVGDTDPDGVRAPMGRTTETLVGPGADFGAGGPGLESDVLRQLQERRSRAGQFNRPGIFNQRDVSSIWNDAESTPQHQARLSRATGGASDSSSKSSMLAEMYRPPFEIMSRLPWDTARDEGREKEKWLLVNIQDPSVFDCQLLNRDLWKNSGVRDTIKEHFLFLQYSKDDPRGAPYIQYYFQGYEAQDNYPHIAIVDPRTGEQMKVWSGPPIVKAADFLMQLHEFLDRYSLKHNVRNPVARRKPEVQPHAKLDTMTEEEMMEMAMKNSLEGRKPVRPEDPDELTRSFGDIKGKDKAPATEEDVEMQSPAANGHQEEAPEQPISPFDTIPSNKPHVEPEADPATTTRIQFRHPSGRVIRRFALDDSVQRLYEWLKASPLEGKEGVEFELVSMGQNLIGMLDSSVQNAGLKNGTVMVGFVED